MVEHRIRPTWYISTRSAGFGVRDVRRRPGGAPLVYLDVASDTTKDDLEHELRPGDTFRAGHELWLLADVRYPAGADWEVVIRRVDDPGAEPAPPEPA